MTDEELRDGLRTMRRIMRTRHAENKRRFGVRHERTCELPELDGLELPPFMPVEHGALYFKDEDERALIQYYDPDGWPFPGEFRESFYRYMAIRDSPAGQYVSPLFYRAGVPIWVSTAYLGIDLGWIEGGPALVWETMAFTGVGWREGFTARYVTRAAALHGHRMVVELIRAAQRARRVNDRLAAPRRGRPFLGGADLQAWARQASPHVLRVARSRVGL